ncbi:epidermal retinol dehydrogenase 2 [Anabrus simplex]|uniref:epidermal retinol dehydrogenase 2 n=1 Tax=Anabrus simplex TaxID=316456 RepID=UPI0035A39F60
MNDVSCKNGSVQTITKGVHHQMTSPGKQEDRNMMVKVYSVLILILDFVAMLFKILFAILEAVYYKIVPQTEKSVVGEVVLITGAGGGIGRELVQQFAELGATIVCWDVNKETNEKVARDLNKQGFKVHAYKCDVTNRDEVLQVAQQVTRDVGDVTVVVNNAGIMPCHPLTAHNPQEIRKTFEVNVLAHFWILEAFLPKMIAKNHGHVVGISSMAGIMGITNLVPYCASKFAVRGMMEALSEELREDARDIKVKFTTILPFIVDTGLCHKPKTRFPSLLGIVPPKKAASEIIKAMRRDYPEMSIPSGLLNLNYFIRLFPVKATQIMKDFMDSGVEPHDTTVC